jgi:hypothetical protein
VVRSAEAMVAAPDGNHKVARSAEAMVAGPDGNQKVVRSAEAMVAGPDGNHEVVRSAEAVFVAPNELAEEARSSGKEEEVARPEDRSIIGRFLDLWKSLRSDFLYVLFSSLDGDSELDSCIFHN